MNDFLDLDTLENYSDEQILYQADQLRRGFLSLESYDKLAKHRHKQIKSLRSDQGLITQTDDVYFDKRISFDTVSYVFCSEKSQELLKRLSTENRLVIFADDFSDLNRFLCNILFKINLEQLYIFVKSNPLIIEPSVNDFHYKRPWSRKVAVHLELCSSKNAGFDLREDSLKEKLLAHINEKTPIIALGEYTTLTFEGALFDYSVICPLRGDKTCKYFGMVPSFEKDELKLFMTQVQNQSFHPVQKGLPGF